MKKALDHLPMRTKDGCVNVVVESPRGSRLKIEFDSKLAAFKVARPLPLGMSYPFDWGFIPSTRASDGDPVDAMLLNDVATYPGVVIECRPVGMVEIDPVRARRQAGKQQSRRVIAAVARIAFGRSFGFAG